MGVQTQLPRAPLVDGPVCCNGCQRSPATGYDTCCKTCIASNGLQHGPGCNLKVSRGWEIETEQGWFYFTPGVRFKDGEHFNFTGRGVNQYEVRFTSEREGEQINLNTGKRRTIIRNSVPAAQR